ncbi:MAG TPA: DegT/DnrJ/EryC1/StrS family aminotransferase [Candidatus Acidoferrum sp.]|nr:DegT/DnrJ/EryC1/StrS family aminotransferase [Candidatus Acidoferrum sp.]
MNSIDAVPFLDLITAHAELETDLVEVFKQALHTAGFIGGPMVEQFEQGFAEFCDTKHCVGVNSGTDAIRFALIAAGVKSGDVVITVPNTFIATTEAISQAGAEPRFVDIDERTYNMDPAKVRDYVENGCTFDSQLEVLIDNKTGKRVTGVVPVHLYGQMADMDALLEIAAKYKLIVIEDACQAHGAQYFSRRENRWRTAGSMGRAAAFSFYPGKNLGACGEAGAVTTNEAALARKIRMLRDHGQSKKYFHDIEGYNGRLDSIQAGILSVKLRHLAEWNRKRQEAARRYDELLSSLDIIKPYCPDWARANYHLYVVRVRNREDLQKHLAEAKIGTGIHYPVPLHLQKAYAGFGYGAGDFPVTEKVTPEIVSLPMFPQLRAEQQRCVVDQVSCFLGTGITVDNVGARQD